jgi:hypothetical protein
MWSRLTAPSLLCTSASLSPSFRQARHRRPLDSPIPFFQIAWATLKGRGRSQVPIQNVDQQREAPSHTLHDMENDWGSIVVFVGAVLEAKEDSDV